MSWRSALSVVPQLPSACEVNQNSNARASDLGTVSTGQSMGEQCTADKSSSAVDTKPAECTIQQNLEEDVNILI